MVRRVLCGLGPEALSMFAGTSTTLPPGGVADWWQEATCRLALGRKGFPVFLFIGVVVEKRKYK